MTRTTPAEAWNDLLAGNQRFIDGTPLHPRQDAERRAALAHSQAPTVALFGCSDSRLAAEVIFDQGLGDLFVVRNAGQVLGDSVVGSLEYAVAVLGVSMLVVLGHDECGAVRAAIDATAKDAAPLPPQIRFLTDRIAPAVRAVAHTAPVTGSIDPATVDAGEVGRVHLRNTVAGLLEHSEIIAAAVADGSLAIVGANYVLSEGRAVPDSIVGLA
ncbi:carbonic anhydrase [Arenivirga flava]|uniref:Carbonic anhydrase n=1 Tax=Arenivirga flava TaxID=1930060 RepID=A0AA37UPT9_9MICO|nr:carbonic anhydrase [Arenivirga flava]GMA29705.1 carbonic anhydrase [Arenivirga flava]